MSQDHLLEEPADLRRDIPSSSPWESRTPQDSMHHRLPLTEREVDILRLMARGMTSEEIGQQLRIATTTVNTHRRNMMERCDCRNSTQLVFLACKEGLL
jgi:DNA-binding NarL/FixJ family response regulator